MRIGIERKICSMRRGFCTLVHFIMAVCVCVCVCQLAKGNMYNAVLVFISLSLSLSCMQLGITSETFYAQWAAKGTVSWFFSFLSFFLFYLSSPPPSLSLSSQWNNSGYSPLSCCYCTAPSWKTTISKWMTCHNGSSLCLLPFVTLLLTTSGDLRPHDSSYFRH